MIKTFYQDDFILQLNDKGFLNLEFYINDKKYNNLISIDIDSLLSKSNKKSIKSLNSYDILNFGDIKFNIFYEYNYNFYNIKLPSLFDNFYFNLYLNDKEQKIRFEFSNYLILEFNVLDDFQFICSQLRYDENIDENKLSDKIRIIKQFKNNDKIICEQLTNINIPLESISINPLPLNDGTYNFELYLTQEIFNVINSNELVFILKNIELNNLQQFKKYFDNKFIIENYLNDLLLAKKYNIYNEGVLIYTFNIKNEGINFYSLLILNSLGGNIWDY